MVMVPVLSTHKTETAPNVSTAGNFRTNDCFLARRHAPMDKNTVKITGNSSGIMAMARVMPDKVLSIIRGPNGWSGILKYVTTPTKANKTAAIPAHSFTKCPVCF